MAYDSHFHLAVFMALEHRTKQMTMLKFSPAWTRQPVPLWLYTTPYLVHAAHHIVPRMASAQMKWPAGRTPQALVPVLVMLVVLNAPSTVTWSLVLLMVMVCVFLPTRSWVLKELPSWKAENCSAHTHVCCSLSFAAEGSLLHCRLDI